MMSLRTQCIYRLIFPLQERLKYHDIVRVRRDMEQKQFSRLEKLETPQEGL